MMDLRSSARSVTIQSNLRGRIAVSRDMTSLLCQQDWKLDGSYFKDDLTCLVHRYAIKHISSPLDTEKLARDPDHVTRVPTRVP